MASDEDFHSNSTAKEIAHALRNISDELENNAEIQRIIQGVVQESFVGRQYTKFTSLIRDFVRLVAHSGNVSANLVITIIRIFLLLWNNRELSGQLLQDMQAETSSPASETISEPPVPGDLHDIPQEVQLMDNESIQQYHKALSHGKEHVKSIRLMVVGMFGVGKTSLVKNLVEIPERNRKIHVDSTVGIDVRRCAIKEDGKWEEDILDFDPNERLLEVMTSHTTRDPVSSVDYVDAGSKIPADNEEILYDRQALQNAQLNHSEESSKGQKSCEDDESFSAFKEKLLNNLNANDDPALKDLFKDLENVKHDPSKVAPCSPTVSIWDFAGQYIYYSTHHFFLNSRSIYLLLMDVSRPLSSSVKEKTEFPLSGYMHKEYTCLEAFKFWLNSIHMYSSQQIYENEIQPTVILVGTHKDKMTGSDIEKEKQKEDYFNEALKSFIDTPLLAHVHRKKFLINNLDCKEDFERIREEVVNLAQKQIYWGETRPAKWIPLERRFLGFKSEGKEIITFDEVRKAGEKNDFRIGNEEELRMFLRFQHSLGNILYYETDLLKDCVILSPQWIIDAFTCFVTHVPDKNPMQLKLWEEYEKKAILTPELISEIIDNSKKSKYFKDYKKEVVLYMEYLDMIARPVNANSYGKEEVPMDCKDNDEDLETDFINADTHEFQQRRHISSEVLQMNVQRPTSHSLPYCKSKNSSSLVPSVFYIVPSLLQARPEKGEISRLINPDCIEKTPILCLKFRDGFMPPSVFHRLVAICIRKYRIVSQGEQHLLYNGLAVFYVTETSTLSIWFQDDIIYARVSFYDKKEYPLAKKIRQFLVQSVTEILRLLPDESRINEIMLFEEYIQCSTGSTFEPGIGLMRMRDFFYRETVMCEHPTLRAIKKDDAIGIWCYEAVQKQQRSAIPDAILKRQPTEKELGRIAMGIGEEYYRLGLELKSSPATLQQIRDTDRFHLPTRIYHILHNCRNEIPTVEYLRNVLIAVDSDIDAFDCVFEDSFGQTEKLERCTGIDFSRKPSLIELVAVAEGIGDEYWLLGIELGIKETRMQQLRLDNPLMPTRVYYILNEWCQRDVNIEELRKAMLLVRADTEKFYEVFRRGNRAIEQANP